jgi:hypothetical protein
MIIVNKITYNKLLLTIMGTIMLKSDKKCSETKITNSAYHYYIQLICTNTMYIN